MNNGHHRDHFLRQPESNFIRKGLNRLSNIILPEWVSYEKVVHFLMKIPIFISLMFIALNVRLDRRLLNSARYFSFYRITIPINIMSELSKLDIMSISLDFLAFAFCLLVEGIIVSIGGIFKLSQSLYQQREVIEMVNSVKNYNLIISKESQIVVLGTMSSLYLYSQ